MQNELLVFIGTYTDPILFGTGKVLEGKGEGIYVYKMDTASGEMELINTKTDVTNPSYLAFDPARRGLYAVNELKLFEGEPTGTISAFSVDPQTGGLKFINKKPTHGTDPCHLTVDKTGRFVLLSNFMSGSVCVLPVRDDGGLDDASDFVQHQGSSVDPNRQQGPHAHAVTLDESNRHAFIPDLGIDRVMVYNFDSKQGKLGSNAILEVPVKPGAGPRHIVIHPNGEWAFLINELDSTITAYRHERDSGKLTEIQTVSSLPLDFKGESTCADIHIAPSGMFVYGSNRGHDSIVIYKIDPHSGMLSYVGHESTQGNTPRNFAIDPSGTFLLVANQDSDTIVTFRIDSQTGKLQSTGQATPVPTPVCIKIIAPDSN
ncbi:MAG: lactonase family protein [Desulfobacterales bacterium]|jgi:6-phosphogluconolactonase